MTDLTLNAVKCAALLLIEKNQTTSSLDVKTLLRTMGYKAYQDQVTGLLKEAADQLHLSVEMSQYHEYREYSLPSDPSTCSSPVKATTVANNITYTKRDNTVIKSIDQKQSSTDDWYVSSKSTSINDIDNSAYFDKKYTRDEVRQAFAFARSVDFSLTRACRI